MRLVIVLAAAGAIAVFAIRLHDADRCSAAQHTVFAVAAGRAPAGDLDPALDHLRGACPGTDALVSAAGGLTFSGRPRQAETLAREATRKEPDSWAAWVALAYATRGRDAATTALARARAHALNPLYRFAPVPPRGRPHG